VLQAHDRLLLITSPDAREPLADFVTPLPEAEASATPEAAVAKAVKSGPRTGN
jgi:hypothetical protein